MAPRSKLTEEERDEIRRLHKLKLPYAALAGKYDVSSRTISRICHPDAYERQKESNRKYQSENVGKINSKRQKNYQTYRLSFHLINDEAVIHQLSKQENVQDYVRKLIMDDIKHLK